MYNVIYVEEKLVKIQILHLLYDQVIFEQQQKDFLPLEDVKKPLSMLLHRIRPEISGNMT
jgi:hypothetical protein